jgi:hypothetical protein
MGRPMRHFALLLIVFLLVWTGLCAIQHFFGDGLAMAIDMAVIGFALIWTFVIPKF